MKPIGVSMYDHMRQRADFAVVYAKDGDYERAAVILEELAADVRNHANELRLVMEELMFAQTETDRGVEN